MLISLCVMQCVCANMCNIKVFNVKCSALHVQCKPVYWIELAVLYFFTPELLCSIFQFVIFTTVGDVFPGVSF